MTVNKFISNAYRVAFLSQTAAVLLATIGMFPIDLSAAAFLRDFTNGRAVVCFDKSNKCVVIDKHGSVVVTPESLSPNAEVDIAPFRNDLAQVKIGSYYDSKVGFIDINGN